MPAAAVADGPPSTSAEGYAACSAPVDLGASTAVGEHTVAGFALAGVAVVVTDAVLTKAECRRLAMSGHDALVRAGHRGPATVFALATGRRELASPLDLDGLCTAVSDVLEPV